MHRWELNTIKSDSVSLKGSDHLASNPTTEHRQAASPPIPSRHGDPIVAASKIPRDKSINVR